MNKILCINGPNINLIGVRQVDIYGMTSLQEIISNLKSICSNFVELESYQSAIEGELVYYLNEQYLNAVNSILGIIINPGAYAHTSIALRDALEMFSEKKVKIFEVHISNIYNRESFRHNSYISSIATGVISGLGAFGYEAALKKILKD